MGSYGFKSLCLVTACILLASGVFIRLMVESIFSTALDGYVMFQVVLTRWDILGGMIVLCGAKQLFLQPQGLVR